MYAPQINDAQSTLIYAGHWAFLRLWIATLRTPSGTCVAQVPHLTATFAAQGSYSLTHGGRNYFADIVAIHMALGLAVTYQDAVAIAYLTPKKEYEVMVMAPTLNDNFARLLVRTRQANACRQMDDISPNVRHSPIRSSTKSAEKGPAHLLRFTACQWAQPPPCRDTVFLCRYLISPTVGVTVSSFFFFFFQCCFPSSLSCSTPCTSSGSLGSIIAAVPSGDGVPERGRSVCVEHGDVPSRDEVLLVIQSG
jgi:hypothetical protein